MNGLAKDLKKWDGDKDRLVRKVPLACLRHLQKESPVLTGRYRAAHTLSVDGPDGWLPDELQASEKKSVIGKNERLSPASRRPHPSHSRQADERFQDAAEKLGGLKARNGLKVYLQNNLEYALHVEARDSVYGKVESRFDRYVKENIK